MNMSRYESPRERVLAAMIGVVNVAKCPCCGRSRHMKTDRSRLVTAMEQVVDVDDEDDTEYERAWERFWRAVEASKRSQPNSDENAP